MFPLLTPEEELDVCKRLETLKQILNSKNFTIDDVNNDLRELGYPLSKINNNIVDVLNDKIFYLNKKYTEFSKNKETPYQQLKRIEEDLDYLDFYRDYKELKNYFISSNLRLVVSIAKRYVGYGIPFMDLIQEGSLGLEKAVEKFEVEKGNKFSTYATWWIRQSVTRSIADHGRTIRIPVHLHEFINKVNYIEKSLAIKLQHTPTDDDIIEYFENEIMKESNETGNESLTSAEIEKRLLSIKERLKEIRKINQSMISLSSPVGNEEDSEFGDFVKDPGESVEETVVKGLQIEYIQTILPNLSSKEKLVILLRFGLRLCDYISFEEFQLILFDQFKKNNLLPNYNVKEKFIYLSDRPTILTLEEIGELLGVSRERIRQIESKGKKKLMRKASKDIHLFLIPVVVLKVKKC